jgi:hypothetical protein
VKQFKKILLMVILLSRIVPAIAQNKHLPTNNGHKAFNQLLKESSLSFTFPQGFQEVKAVNNEDYSYDFAMQSADQDFEVWLQVKPGRQNWFSYLKSGHDNQHALANPDSTYVELSGADAMALSSDSSFLVRSMPPEVLARYNADIGKSYLINLTDRAITKHFKYALIVALQKRHTATLIAVYFTNEKDADFYRSVYKAAHCLRFTSPPAN